ncbi:phospholipase A2 OS2 [Lingula anatina]|uniref:Phospholipase A2 n=1 Tax=Lingula anatina TaxID=7574 RepID=A0A1S3J314_LINAN|nr:phospholipase A2 OS2 [Lingula anatina]|eukprot:XP_013404807.1 phospholipase A2 OS2 [Lingula anatina]
MKFTFNLVALVVLSAALIEAKPHKRNIAQFGAMISIATGRSPFDYNNYGCFCGVGGQGTPIDGVDRCCQAHDSCYTAATASGCNTYLDFYHFTSKDKTITCDSSQNDACEQSICNCDKVAVECFAKNIYRKKHKGKC